MNTTHLEQQVITKGREALARAVRQAIQALIPTLLVVVGGSITGLNVGSIAVLAGITILISLLKSAGSLQLSPSDPPWALAAERAITAAAGTALGLVTADGVTPNAVIDWQALLTASAGSAVLALAMYFTNPPVVQGQVIGPVADVPLPAPLLGGPFTTEPGQDGDF